MKTKITILLLFLSVLANAQMGAEDMKKLSSDTTEAVKVLKIKNDLFTATTQVDTEDTTLVTLQYLIDRYGKYNEEPFGDVDGVNNTFRTHYELIANTAQVYVDGVLQDTSYQYSEVDGEIVFESDWIPQPGERVRISYIGGDPQTVKIGIIPTGSFDYYVSATGSDAADGTTPETAWQTLAKVNATTFSPGDSIGFNCGDAWEGTLTPSASGTSGNPVVYGAYGSGLRPKIYGSDTITAWTLHSGYIYKKVVSTEVKQLFIDGTAATLARYPKTGWADATTINTTTQYVSTDITSQATDYYKDALFVCRSNPYIIDKRTVTGSTGQTITVDAAPSAAMSVGDGFFMANKLEFLTQAGEWCFDVATMTVYAWMPDSTEPAGYTIRGAKDVHGINTNTKDYIVIKDMDIEECGQTGIYINGSDNVTIKNSIVNGCIRGGIYGYGSTYNLTIEDNTVSNIFARAIHIGYGTGNYITGNTVSEIGRITNIARRVTGENYNSGSGISSGYGGLGGAIITYNKLSNIGYVGIAFYSGVHYINHNYINGALLEQDDGGAIYTFNDLSNYAQAGAAGSVVEYNIINNALGNYDGTTYGSSQGHGIYLDNKTHDVTVRNNLVATSSHGINLHDGGRNTVSNNTFYDNIVAINSSDQQEASDVDSNYVYATDRTHPVLFSITYPRLTDRRGTADNNFDYNKYFVPYNETAVFVQYANWAAWQADGNDANGTYDGTDMASGEDEAVFYNSGTNPITYYLNGATARTPEGEYYTGSFELTPFTWVILMGTNLENIIP